MADMPGMDPLARAWHEMYRKSIGKEVLAAQASAALAATPSVMEEPPVIDEPNVMEVPAPFT
jgi:hypothetical protein